jgi:hypothetical protein
MTPAYPDWNDFWQLTIRWVSQPIPGVVLPPTAQAAVATVVFDQFLNEFSKLPRRDEALGFLQQRSRQAALAHTASARLTADNPELWRDLDWKPGGQGLHPTHLNSTTASIQTTAWQALVRDMKVVAMPIIRRQGVVEADAEGVYFKVLAELDQGRNGTSRRALDEVLVYEQIPRLIAVMARNQAIDLLRAHGRRKNTPNQTGLQESLDQNESIGQTLADPQATRWLDDPFSALTFDQIHVGCKDTLTQLQWRVVTGLFIDEQTMLDLCEDDSLLTALDLPTSASVSTRRRRLGEQLQSALDRLAGCLKSRDLWPSH